MAILKIKLKKSVAFAVFFAVILGRGAELFWGYAAAILHECAHLAMSICLNQKPKQIRLGICGINLKIKGTPDIKKSMMISASGPLARFFMFGVLFCMRKLGVASIPLFEFANLCIGVANIIPAMPLDGGAILRSALVAKFGVISGAKIMRKITHTLIVMLGFICTVIHQNGYFNIFLIIFEVFLFFSSFAQQKHELREKKQVVSGEVESKGKIKYFAFSSNKNILDVASRISPSYYIVAAIFENGRFIGELNQCQIIEAIQKKGAFCSVGEALNNK